LPTAPKRCLRFHLLVSVREGIGDEDAVLVADEVLGSPMSGERLLHRAHRAACIGFFPRGTTAVSQAQKLTQGCPIAV
jgi:hypothetical protein